MRSAIRESIQTVALAVLIILVVQQTLRNYAVYQSSMLPRLHEGDRVLVDKLSYLTVDATRVGRYLPWVDAAPGQVWQPFKGPELGDVVVFHFPRDPSQDFVKRIIGTPGDRVEIIEGKVFVNAEPIDEPYVAHQSRETRPPVIVGRGQYYVLGDNRLQSDDSRQWGMVPRNLIVGKVWIEYWPPSRFSALFVR